MKLVIAMSLILLTGCVQFDRQWSTENRRLEVAYQVIHAADAVQTLQMTNRSDLKEGNSAWLLGEHPSAGKVWVWYLGTAYAHTFVTDALDERAPRWVCRAWQVVTIGDAANAVYGNYQLGLKVGF
jgi:hypothetical protein